MTQKNGQLAVTFKHLTDTSKSVAKWTPHLYQVECSQKRVTEKPTPTSLTCNYKDQKYAAFRYGLIRAPVLFL